MSKVREWVQRPSNLALPTSVVDLMARRRRQMLVHCFIYYHLDSNVVSDHSWMAWAQELAALQVKHGHRINFYDHAFKDWDGSSGFHLGKDDPDVARVAQRTLDHFHFRINKESQ